MNSIAPRPESAIGQPGQSCSERLDREMFRPDITGMKPDNNDDLSGLPILRPKVAGIDLASEIHWVCKRKN